MDLTVSHVFKNPLTIVLQIPQAITINMTPDLVKQLVDAITGLINADSGNAAALQAAQATIAQLQQTAQALNDPALVASVNAALTAAAAAAPAPAPADSGTPAAPATP